MQQSRCPAVEAGVRADVTQKGVAIIGHYRTDAQHEARSTKHEARSTKHEAREVGEINVQAKRYRLVDLALTGTGEAAATLLNRHIVKWKPIFTAVLTEREAQAVVRSRLRVNTRSLATYVCGQKTKRADISRIYLHRSPVNT